jgi:allantoinase
VEIVSNPRIPYELSDQLPPLRPLGDKRLLVHLVVNVEHWPFDAPMPRKLLGSPHGRDNVPDLPNFGWVEYGMRAGLPRILRALAARGLPASASMNASVIEAYPAAAAAILDAGWELVGHGLTQRSLPGSDEAAVVAEALDRLEAFSGTRPRGWLGPGLAETVHTPDVLAAAGIEYVYDWMIDDVPLWLSATPRPIVAMPYTMELNDSVMYAGQWHPAQEFERRVTATLAALEQETADSAKVLTLGLHPHLVGVAHRIAAFERSLDRLLASPQTTFTTGASMLSWYTAQVSGPSQPAT